MRINYRQITSYKVLPPKARIIYPEGSLLSPAERHLQDADNMLKAAESRVQLPSHGSYDLVAQVFNNQAATHASNSIHSAELIAGREKLAQKQLADIQWRLDELLARRPLRREGPTAPPDEHKLTDVEKHIIDLEKQQRVVQLALWRDVLDLRKDLVSERREYRARHKRMSYLIGSEYGTG